MRLLQDIQSQGEHLLYLERETSKDREYLKKVRFLFLSFWRNDSLWAGPLDDDLFYSSGPSGSVADYDPMM